MISTICRSDECGGHSDEWVAIVMSAVAIEAFVNVA